MHRLTWDLVSRISLLLGEAELPRDDAITDFTDETMFTQIYNIAQYANLFADLAMKACTLAHSDGIGRDEPATCLTTATGALATSDDDIAGLKSHHQTITPLN